jgi:hypothetical protein
MRTRYTRFQLVRQTIKDLISDIRTSEGAYREQCRKNVATLFAARHTTQLDQFGWPTVLDSN